MEVDMPFVEVSLSSETARGKPQPSCKGGPAQKKPNLKSRVEVFTAACQGAGLTVAAGRLSAGPHRQRHQQHDIKTHCSADAATIEAILMGVQPDPLSSGDIVGSRGSTSSCEAVLDSSIMPTRVHSLSSSTDHPTFTPACTEPDNPLTETPKPPPASQPEAPPTAGPQSQNPLLQYFSRVKSKCKAAAAAAALLAARPNKGATGGSTGGDCNRGSGSDSDSAMGEDPCPYRFALTGPDRPSWPLGASRKALKQQQDACAGSKAATTTMAAKPTSAPRSSGASTPPAGTAYGARGSDSDSSSEIGEDPCPHKFTLTAGPRKASWLLGISRKVLKQQQSVPAASTAATTTAATPAAAAGAPMSRTVSKRCRDAWQSFSSRLKPKAASSGVTKS